MAIRAVFDTTYFLPAFGLRIDIDSSENIINAIERFNNRGNTLIVSDITPLEGFLKAFSIAEKQRNETGKNRAREGFLSMVNDPLITIVSHQQRTVFEEAFKIRMRHKDVFDCFVFATAVAENVLLVTEDESSSKHVKNVIRWTNFIRKYVS
ncbi:MAG: PIN domain-containing protein [Nitrososphaerales archaeon]